MSDLEIRNERDDLRLRVKELEWKLAQQAATIGDLASLLMHYRLEHSQQNCYFSGPTGAICDECIKVDNLLAKVPKEKTSV